MGDKDGDRRARYLSFMRDIAQLTQWARENPDCSAGVWADDSADDAQRGIRVGIVGDLARPEAELRALLENPALLELVPRRFTEAELRKLQGRIADERMTLKREGAGYQVTLVGVDVLANRTMIGIHPYTEAFAAELSDEYGADRVVVSAQQIYQRQFPAK